MADYGNFKFGGTTYPLTSSTANSLLQDADPTVYYALDFFSSMITTHVGARLMAVATAANINEIATPVANTIPYDPTPYMGMTQFKFPLLAVYRKTGTTDEHTMGWIHDQCELDCQYILPPITAGEIEAVYPILHAIGQVLINRTQQGFDPTYNNGEKVWSAPYAGLESIGFIKYLYGSYPGMGDLIFPAWIGTFVVKEQVGNVTGQYQNFAGADVEIDVKASDGTTLIADQFASDVVRPGPG